MTVRVSVLAVAFAMMAACASNSTTTSPTSPSTTTCTLTGSSEIANGTMTATIDGAPWTGICLSVLPVHYNSLALDGSDEKQWITLQAAVTGPGTYSITDGEAFAGLNGPGAVNGIPTVALWQATNTAGGTGTLTITQFSTTSAIGTFSFTAVPIGAGATGNKVVTSGAFNITFSAPN